MQLSEYFKLEEFTNSDTAKNKGINNTPDTQVLINIVRLHDNTLYKLRKNLGHPVIITSGYRCKALNTAVGGAANSQHLTGEAADFVVQGQTNGAVFNWCKKNLEFDQLILEQSGSSCWVHISYKFNGNRRQALKFDGKKYICA